MRGTLLLVLAVLIVPVLVVQAVVYQWRFETRRLEEYSTNLEFARGVARAFDMYVSDVLHQQLTIGRALTTRPDASRDAAVALLGASAEEYPSVSRQVWLDAQGKVVAAVEPEGAGLELGQHAYVPHIAEGRSWVVTDLMRDAAGEPFFVIARGIRDVRGTLRGIVAASVDPRRLGGELAIARRGDGAVAIIDRNGRGVYRHPEIELTWEQRDWLTTQPIIGAALRGEEVSGTFVSVFDGQVRMSGLTPIGAIGWVAGANRPEAEVLGPVRNTMLKQFAALALSIGAAALVALAVARTLTRSISRLREHALAVGGGEFGRVLTIDHPAELAATAEAFNRMAVEIQQRDAERQRLLATIAHELRAPLAPLRHNVYFLERSAARGADAKPALAAIGRQVGQISRLIEDLLDVHRVAVGKLTLSRERVDVARIVRTAVEDVRAVYVEHGVDLELYTRDRAVFVEADPMRVAQIIGNLLHNSAKFTPRGGWTRVTVSTEAGYAVVRVSDSGIGIAREALDQVFQPFAQLEHHGDGDPARRGGLGLGLALVKSLVEIQDGSVSVESEGLGKGAQFTVRLPLALDDGAPPREASSSSHGERAPHFPGACPETVF